jgi:hypothetical protein
VFVFLCLCVVYCNHISLANNVRWLHIQTLHGRYWRVGEFNGHAVWLQEPNKAGLPPTVIWIDGEQMWQCSASALGCAFYPEAPKHIAEGLQKQGEPLAEMSACIFYINKRECTQLVLIPTSHWLNNNILDLQQQLEVKNADILLLTEQQSTDAADMAGLKRSFETFRSHYGCVRQTGYGNIRPSWREYQWLREAKGNKGERGDVRLEGFNEGFPKGLTKGQAKGFWEGKAAQQQAQGSSSSSSSGAKGCGKGDKGQGKSKAPTTLANAAYMGTSKHGWLNKMVALLCAIRRNDEAEVQRLNDLCLVCKIYLFVMFMHLSMCFFVWLCLTGVVFCYY